MAIEEKTTAPPDGSPHESLNESLDESHRAIPESLVDECDGLVVIDSTTKKIHLFHDSVYDYFRRHPIIQAAEAHKNIAITCLQYILRSPFDKGQYLADGDLENKLAKFPLFTYATQYWGDHARNIQDSTLIEFVQKLALKYLNNKELLEVSVRAGAISGQQCPDYTRRFTEGMTSIHVAASFGLKSIVECLLRQEINTNEVDADGRTALHIAAEGGYLKVADLLLKRLPSAQYKGDRRGRTPLHLAALNGHRRVVDRLVPKGSYPDTRDSYGRTALHLAALNGHDSTMCCLLKKSADPDATDSYEQTALHLAALNGHDKALRDLLKTRANPDATDSYGQTALHLAALNGHQVVVKALMSNPNAVVNANIMDVDHRTAMHIAAWRGNREIAKMLFRGEFVDAKDKHGLTALHYAASQGHQGVVTMLLENGADIHAGNDARWTALHSASLKRRDIANPLAVNQLPDTRSAPSPHVEKQPDPTQLVATESVISFRTLTQQAGRNSTQIISNANFVSTSRVIVPSYPDANIIPEGSQPGILRLLAIQDELVSRRCDLKCKHEGVMKLLMDRGSTIDRKCRAILYFPLWGYTTTECTPLHLAVLSGHEAAVRALLQKGCNFRDSCRFDTSSKSSAVLTPWHLATMLGSEGMVELLLKEEEPDDQEGVNSSWSVEFRHGDYVSGMPAFVLHAQGTGLHLAVATRNMSMARLLQKKGVGSNSPLSLAASLSTRTGKIQVHTELRPPGILGGEHKDDEADFILEGQINVGEDDFPASLGPDNVPVKMTTLRLEIPSFGSVLRAECQIGDTLRETLLERFFSFATTQGSVATLWQLLGNKLDTNAKSKADMYREYGGGRIHIQTEVRALDVAAIVGDADAVGLLYERTHNPEVPTEGQLTYEFDPGLKVHVQFNCKLIHLAALSGSKEVVRLLLKKELLANQKGTINIEIKHESSQDESFVNISLNVEEATAMHLAICRGAGDVLRVLLDGEADRNALAYTSVSCKSGGEIHADMILTGYQTPLQFAVFLGKPELVEQILMKDGAVGGMVEFKISCQLSKSSFAFEGNGTAMVLHIAAFQGSNAIVEILLKYGADVNTKCPGTVCVKKWTDLAVPDIIIRVERGLTALHLAALLGNDDLVKLLLKKRADIEAKSDNQMTPLDVARAMGNKSTILLLQPGTTETSVRDMLLDSGRNQIQGDFTRYDPIVQKLRDKHPERQVPKVRYQEDNSWLRQREPKEHSAGRSRWEEHNIRGRSPGDHLQPQRYDNRRRQSSGSQGRRQPKRDIRNETREPHNLLWYIWERVKARWTW